MINPEPPAHLPTQYVDKEDLARVSGLDVYSLRQWNRYWTTIYSAWILDRRAEAVMVRGAVVAMGTDGCAFRFGFTTRA